MDSVIWQYLTKAKQQKDRTALRSAHQLIRLSRADGAKQTDCTSQLYVICAEEAVQLGCIEISTDCLKLYFEGKPVANQFLSRAYLCQGQMKSPLCTGNVEDFENALPYFLKAIEISKDNPEYHFMVYNASLLYFQAARPLLRPGRSRQLVPSLTQVLQALEEVAEPDHSWRAQLEIHLVECVVDSGKMKDASRLVTTTAQFVDSYSPHLYPQLFSILIRHKLFNSDLVTMMAQNPALQVIYKIQALKNGEKGASRENAENLKKILHLLLEVQTPGSGNSPAPILVTDRVALLFELAQLALQLKHHEVAARCLRELKSMGEATVAQGIMAECLQRELTVLKKEGKMKVCSKANVEALLKEIRCLDLLLQRAVKAWEPQAVQAVCATQWNLCLPLLQANLRKHIKTELGRVAQALQDVQSNLLEMRCQVHCELAAMEEEEGHLHAALAHMEAAMTLDDGTQRERLAADIRLLRLGEGLRETPTRPEEQAAVLMQQARHVQSGDVKDSGQILVSVGQLLAPDAFHGVLDADDISKIPSVGSGPAAQQSCKALHHIASVRWAEGHLDRLGKDSDSTERVKLWAALVKLARKRECWDVCRAACRFCLLYDDGRWAVSKEGESRSQGLYDHKVMQDPARDMLLLLAEVCIINAEATLHKLRMEGVKLYSPATPPKERGVTVSEDDPQWAVYRDWLQALSAYVMSNLQRAGELAVEIGELWLLGNSAVYLWNYSTHLLEGGEHQHLLPTMQNLLELFRQTDYTGDRALSVLLCVAVARGLIQPLYGPDGTAPTLDLAVRDPASQSTRGISRIKKETSRPIAQPADSTDQSALHNVLKALELCDHALLLSNCSGPGEDIPIAFRRHVVVTWVEVKRLLRQPVGTNMEIKVKCTNEKVSAMTRVLVGVEILACANNPSDFSVPSLPALVCLASDCSWSSSVVELHVWSQLAAFCLHAGNNSLLLTCSHKALQLEDAAALELKTTPCTIYGPQAVNEMLSSVTCLRGKSLAYQCNRNQQGYKEAMNILLSSVRYAVKAGNTALCRAAVKHYWNTCVPLTQSSADRLQLQAPLEEVLSALATTSNKMVAGLKTVKGLVGSSDASSTNEDDYLTLQRCIHTQLFDIHSDRGDWKSAMQVLNTAIRTMPATTHRLPLLKQRVLLRARLGESVHLDMERFQEEGELWLSSVWHQVALCTSNVEQKLTSYQNAIESLVSAESQWLKVSLLLEFGEWLYCQNFPISNAQHQIEWAIDILLQIDAQQSAEAVGVQGSGPSQLKWRGVRCLDNLVRAYTVMAVMADRTSAQQQLDLFRAYTCVLQMWRVSLATEPEVFSDTKSQTPQPPPSSASKKEKGAKMKEKLKETKSDPVFPSTPEQWARYVCPDRARETFRASSSCYCINRHTITTQAQSLYYLDLLVKELHSLSLAPLTLPILHLAEVIAHDLLDREGLSDLYRLRIVKTCSQMGVETCSPYYDKLLFQSSVQEQEQKECRKAIVFLQEKKKRVLNQRIEQCDQARPGQRFAELCAQDIWLDKAEICLGMGLYQAARELLAEAHLVALELGEEAGVARSLLGLAKVACVEQNHSQALVLLKKARALAGDEHFWYQLSLTTVQATLGQGGQNSHTEVDKIVKQGCGVLRSVLEQQLNRAQYLKFLITSLETRTAMECIRRVSSAEQGKDLPFHAIQMLLAACDTLAEGASGLIQMGYREAAVEAHLEHVEGLRILAKHSTNKELQRRYFLDAFSHMQQAVSDQEELALNVQRLVPSQEESGGVSLACVRRLQSLRLSLAEVCVSMLERVCVELQSHALAMSKNTSVERLLDRLTRGTPEPGSVDEEWQRVTGTVGQVALDQLATLNLLFPDRPETKAHCLSLLGRCKRLLSIQQDPLLACGLWDRPKQMEEERAVPAASEAVLAKRPDLGGEGAGHSVRDSERDSDRDSGRISERDGDKHADRDGDRHSDRDSGKAQARVLSDKSAEQWRRRWQAQQLLEEARETLAQAVSLCLQHKLHLSVLASASLNMLECHGHSDPVNAGQHLALLQSCCSSASMARVLRAACSDTSSSLTAALLNLHWSLSRSLEEPPNSMLEGTEDSLSTVSMAYRQLIISPEHLNMLEELPPNLRILLLQHTEDGSELYGAIYENTKSAKSSLACSGVAKVSVCPKALLALQEQNRTFGQETRRFHLKEACKSVREGGRYAPENIVDKQKLECDFRAIVQGVEDYLNPVLSQLDFSCLGSTQSRNQQKIEEKSRLEKDPSPEVSGNYVVLLVDQGLLELPLEALVVLQEEDICSVSRDFSLQLLHSRLQRSRPQEPEKAVEIVKKKEAKVGKGVKADQSKAIKVVPEFRVLPPNTIPVEKNNFIYVVDTHDEGIFEGSTQTEWMRKTMESHGQECSSLWEGITDHKKPNSLGDLERLLCKCVGLIYLGTERFMANITPAKLVALDMSECQMAVLFDLAQTSTSSLHQLNRDMDKSAVQLALERPLQAALLLSLCGVRCIVLNQWHTTPQTNAHNMASVLAGLLTAELTSGQAVHSLRRRDGQQSDCKATGSHGPHSASSSDDVHNTVPMEPSAFNCVLFGLPNVIIT